MYFVCRWREESPFSKRVVATPDSTVLGWFAAHWDPRTRLGRRAALPVAHAVTRGARRRGLRIAGVLAD